MKHRLLFRRVAHRRIRMTLVLNHFSELHVTQTFHKDHALLSHEIRLWHRVKKRDDSYVYGKT